MIVARILGWILVVLALTVAGIALALWLSGQNFAAVAGQIWYQFNPGSLNHTQAFIQRYIHPALWDYGLLPLLQQPAYKALAIAFLSPFLLGIALLIFGRKRDRRRRFS